MNSGQQGMGNPYQQSYQQPGQGQVPGGQGFGQPFGSPSGFNNFQMPQMPQAPAFQPQQFNPYTNHTFMPRGPISGFGGQMFPGMQGMGMPQGMPFQQGGFTPPGFAVAGNSPAMQPNPIQSFPFHQTFPGRGY